MGHYFLDTQYLLGQYKKQAAYTVIYNSYCFLNLSIVDGRFKKFQEFALVQFS